MPGRLCLLGEHSDWAGEYRTGPPGAAIVAVAEQGLRARARRLAARELRFDPGPGRRGALRVPFDALPEAVKHPFFGPVAATALELLAAHEIGGFAVDVVRSDLPIGKGLGSSAAACVLLVRAARALYDLPVGVEGEMRFAYAGERRAGSLCGRMDQVCAIGPSCVLMEFEGARVRMRRLRPGGAFHLVLVELGPTKDTRRILRDLHRCFPDAPGKAARRCREALGLRNRAIVQEASAAVRRGDVAELGRCLVEAQALFDRDVAPLSPALAEPRLHALLGIPFVRRASCGGKGVGSHGDGCAQILARDAACQAELLRRIPGELGLRAFALSIGALTRRGARAGPVLRTGR